MSFWLRKTPKSKSYNKKIKVNWNVKINVNLHTVSFPLNYILHITLPWTVLAELWLSLEEHQYALELIMGRYRKQMLQLMMAKKELDTKPVLSLHEDHAKVWQISSKLSLKNKERKVATCVGTVLLWLICRRCRTRWNAFVRWVKWWGEQYRWTISTTAQFARGLLSWRWACEFCYTSPGKRTLVFVPSAKTVLF